MSKGMATFTLFGKLATVSGLVFPLSELRAGGSTICTSVGCTTLPPYKINMIQLDIVVTFFGVAVKKPVVPIAVYLALFTVHTYDIHVALWHVSGVWWRFDVEWLAMGGEKPFEYRPITSLIWLRVGMLLCGVKLESVWISEIRWQLVLLGCSKSYSTHVEIGSRLDGYMVLTEYNRPKATSRLRGYYINQALVAFVAWLWDWCLPLWASFRFVVGRHPVIALHHVTVTVS